MKTSGLCCPELVGDGTFGSCDGGGCGLTCSKWHLYLLSFKKGDAVSAAPLLCTLPLKQACWEDCMGILQPGQERARGGAGVKVKRAQINHMNLIIIKEAGSCILFLATASDAPNGAGPWRVLWCSGHPTPLAWDLPLACLWSISLESYARVWSSTGGNIWFYGVLVSELIEGATSLCRRKGMGCMGTHQVCRMEPVLWAGFVLGRCCG